MTSATSPMPLARQEAPVTLPVRGEPIPSGLEPEVGQTLRVLGWPLYVKPGLLKRFEEETGVAVEWTEFNTMEEALAVLRTGESTFDLFFPTVDVINALATAGELQPLNHDYLPNLSNLWPSMHDPFYDQGSRYTAAYFVWTTGIAWRNDVIPDATVHRLDNPYDVFWDPAFRGHVGLLNGSREAIAMSLLRNGVLDVNTGNPAELEMATDELLVLVDELEPHFDHLDYKDLFHGTVLHQSWSGNIGFARFYAPDLSDVAHLSYWWPPQGGTGFPGVIGSDTMVVLRRASTPVAAHMLINFLLGVDVALENALYEGYQPPLEAIGPEDFLRSGVIPPSLRNITVREEDFAEGLQLLALPPAVDQLWQELYDQVVGPAA